MNYLHKTIMIINLSYKNKIIQSKDVHDPNPNGKCLKLNQNDTKQSLDYSPNNIVQILILI